jgi:hypothetical protein
VYVLSPPSLRCTTLTTRPARYLGLLLVLGGQWRPDMLVVQQCVHGRHRVPERGHERDHRAVLDPRPRRAPRRSVPPLPSCDLVLNRRPAAGVTFLALLASLSTHVTVQLVASLLSFLAAVITLVAFAIDIALYTFLKHQVHKLAQVDSNTNTGAGQPRPLRPPLLAC